MFFFCLFEKLDNVWKNYLHSEDHRGLQDNPSDQKAFRQHTDSERWAFAVYVRARYTYTYTVCFCEMVNTTFWLCLYMIVDLHSVIASVIN